MKGHLYKTDTTEDASRGHSSGRGRHREELHLAPGATKRGRAGQAEESQEAWKTYVRQHYSELHSRTYFVPPVHFNRVTHESRDIAGVKVKVLIPSKQLSDVREDEVHQRVHISLHEMLQEIPGGKLVVSGLDFDTYLNKLGAAEDTTKPELSLRGGKHPRVALAGRQFGDLVENRAGWQLGQGNPGVIRPRDLPTHLQRGTFDVIILARNHGIVVCEIKSLGDFFRMLGQASGIVNEQEIVRSKLKRALKQLDKEKTVLRHLTRDLDPHLSITSALFLPNLTRSMVEGVVLQDKALEQDFCACLGRPSLSDALSCCVFSEQLPPIGRPWETGGYVRQLLLAWWRGLVTGTAVSSDVYESLAARFCGPATPLHVNTACHARAVVSTLPDAVREIADCFRECTLTAEQINVIHTTGNAQVYLTGPPGTGKTTLLILKAVMWARDGHDVYVISLWTGSEAASLFIFYQIREHLPTKSLKDKVKLLRNKTGNLADVIANLFGSSKGQSHQDDTERKGSNKQLTTTEPETTFRADAGDVDMASEPEMLQVDTGKEAERLAVREVRKGGGIRHGSHFEDEEIEFEPSETKLTDDSANQMAFSKPERRRSTEFESTDLSKPGSSQDDLPGFLGSAPREFHEKKPSVSDDTRINVSSTSVHLIFDEAPWFFPRFVQRLATEGVASSRHLHVWAASGYYGSRPKDFKEVKLTRCLRCPPVVTREFESGAAYGTRAMYPYATGDSGVLSSMPPPTDGPRVERITHDKHKVEDVWECEECGRMVARFLREELKIGSKETNSSESESLTFSDVVISGYVSLTSDVSTSTEPDEKDSLLKEGACPQLSVRKTTGDRQSGDKTASREADVSGFLAGLTKGKIPYDVISKSDPGFAEKLSTPGKPDRVQVAEPECILGLKWAVVVVVGTTDTMATCPRYVDPWCDVVARALAQLVVVGNAEPRLEDRFARQLVL